MTGPGAAGYTTSNRAPPKVFEVPKLDETRLPRQPVGEDPLPAPLPGQIFSAEPIAARQLTQQKLAEIALEVNRGTLVALHLGRMKDAGTLQPHHVSLGKMGNVRGAIEAARTARTILGGNGITLEYPIIRHMNNLESVLTYEGTHEVHTLVVGHTLTGFDAFR